MADIIELSDLDFNSNSPKSQTNFGGGIELLMNNNVKSSSEKKSDIDLEDLNNLEVELNDLVEDIDMNDDNYLKSDLFRDNTDEYNNEPMNVKFEEPVSLGKSTANTDKSDNKTWDGYDKFNNIPIDPDKAIPTSQKPQMTKEELLREKFKYLRKLEALEKKGVELSKKYNMESSLQEMMGEYETIIEEKEKSNSVKFQGNMLMACINGIEFLNSKLDPFDIKLDGWSEQVNENINDYDDVFGELYEKYKSKASLAPELKLLFQLGGSAMMVHMTNTMFKSAMPGMDDILRQNPDLMRSFQSAAVNTMSDSNPGFSNFMSGVMGNDSGPPPAPLSTQGPNSVPPPYYRPGNNESMRNDNMNFNMHQDDGISFKEQTPLTHEKSSRKRPEMKGPSDINDILSGLKTKTIDIQKPAPPVQHDVPIHENSTISISDLKSLQSESNMPKKSKRRGKNTNTVSLDI